MAFGIRDYRQVCKAIVRNFILHATDPYLARYFGVYGDDDAGGLDERRDDAQQPFAQQSGHARGTAGFAYGFTQVDIGRLDGEAFERQLQASQQWHIWGGIYGPVAIDTSDGSSRIFRSIRPPLGHQVRTTRGRSTSTRPVPHQHRASRDHTGSACLGAGARTWVFPKPARPLREGRLVSHYRPCGRRGGARPTATASERRLVARGPPVP